MTTGPEARRPKHLARAPLLVWAVALFGAAFALRLLFWRATAGAARPDSPYFKGDAFLWLEYAQALRAGQPFELGLPLHPPGAGYVLALFGSGTFWPMVVWCALGALAATLAAVAIERAFGATVGRLAGVLMAASTGLLILSTSLNSETPYLVLVAGSFYLWPETRPGRVAAWGALNGLACLFRVEHALFFGLAFLVRRPSARGLAAALGGFVLALLPWHAHAWRAVHRVNTEAPPSAAVSAVADRVASLPWDDEAVARRQALPGFARDAAATFVAATVAHRGGSRVRAGDLRILEDAFGYLPRPIAPFPFVSVYGPLNFALANHPRATGGFSTAALEEPPPLLPRPDAYPPELVRGLPPPQLALSYPPHLRLVNEGYRTSWQWRLAGAKLRRLWSGAAHGFTGYGFPVGIEGMRYAVDIVSPREGRWWRLLLLALCGLGLATAWRRRALDPWLLFLLSKALTAVFFFGYARLGATAFPVVALLVALAVERWTPRRVLVPAALLLILGVEAARFNGHPALRLDGRPAAELPATDHADRSLSRQP